MNLLTFGCRLVLRRLPVCAVIVLAGCVDPAGGWYRPSTTDQQRSADYDECTEMTRDLSSREDGIDKDIVASRGQDWRNAGVFDDRSSAVTGSNDAYADHVLYTCMKDKGYQPKR